MNFDYDLMARLLVSFVLGGLLALPLVERWSRRFAILLVGFPCLLGAFAWLLGVWDPALRLEAAWHRIGPILRDPELKWLAALSGFLATLSCPLAHGSCQAARRASRPETDAQC